MVAAAVHVSLWALASAQAIEVPVTRLPLSPVHFTCYSDGFPTVRLDGRGENRRWSFNQVAGDPHVMFALKDPAGTAAYDGGDTDGVYRVEVRGTTVQPMGVDEGVPARMELTIHVESDHVTTADFSVQAGSFSRTEAGCAGIGVTPMLGERNP